MRFVDVIARKRDGGDLSTRDIQSFIDGVVTGEIPDYQTAALAMAIYFNGMTLRETMDMTLAMASSGEMVELEDVIRGTVVDKHSTGGVGDKTTLVVAPLVSACGAPVGKMSGRGLGYSGGTLDKMESFPGFRTSLTTTEFTKQLADIGIVLSGQTADLAPADGKIYALRDVTGTVPVMPLIASSVMAKKIAGGAHVIVLDVKFGRGTFVATRDEARQLAEIMVEIGKRSGRRTLALLSSMEQPLGNAVGNVLEVQEAMATLRGDGPADLMEHCLEVASHMLTLSGVVHTKDAAGEVMAQAIASGAAMDKFRQLVGAQGGDTLYVDEPDRLAEASLIEQANAEKEGYLRRIDARAIGEASVLLGAGRAKKEDSIDPTVGIVVHRKVGDPVTIGDPIFTIYANNRGRLREASKHALDGIVVSDQPTDPIPLFHGVID